MRTAVLTVVHGRTGHLHNQLRGLARSSVACDSHVIVAVDDPTVRDNAARWSPGASVVECGAEEGRLPMARARNLAAERAIADEAELLIFLDVDCIPAPRLVARYRDAAHRHPGALLCGPVTYLPAPGVDGYDLADLDSSWNPHPARPAPENGVVVPSVEYQLFWSLSFAVTSLTWRRIGGFWPGYTGYGGEDTDFGQQAAHRGVPLMWVGGADAYHQYHPVSDPPVEHLADIVRNANIFHQRWGWWPMGGWLDEFDRRSLIARDHAGKIRVLAAEGAASSFDGGRHRETVMPEGREWTGGPVSESTDAP